MAYVGGWVHFVGQLSTRTHKRVWRSRFLTFCFRTFVDSDRKSLASRVLHLVGATGGPIFGDITRVLSVAAGNSAGKFRANQARRATKWGFVLFRFVRHQSFNAVVAEIAEE
jgi:hypothetical protein